MTQEDKELLLTDLCARTLYGVICLNKVTKEVYKLCYVTSYNEISLDDRTAVFYSPDDIIPYLRPMSSMTEKEKKEYASLIQNVHWTMVGLEARGILSIDLAECKNDDEGSIENIYKVIPLSPIDWLNKHHFDYQGLIKKGLALEAPEDMYEI